MPKQPAKGDAAIQKAQNKHKQRKLELFVFYVNGKVRKQIRDIK